MRRRVAVKSRLLRPGWSRSSQRRWTFPGRRRRSRRNSNESLVLRGCARVADSRASIEGGCCDCCADNDRSAHRSDSKSDARQSASIAYDDPRTGHDLITAKVKPNIVEGDPASIRPGLGHAVHCAGGKRHRRQPRGSSLREQHWRRERCAHCRHVVWRRQVAGGHGPVPGAGSPGDRCRAVQGAEHVEQFLRLSGWRRDRAGPISAGSSCGRSAGIGNESGVAQAWF